LLVLVAVAIVERLEFFKCVHLWLFVHSSTLSAYTVVVGESVAMMMPSSTAAFAGLNALRAAAPSEVPGVEDMDAELELEVELEWELAK
jgi:hypothetical protein